MDHRLTEFGVDYHGRAVEHKSQSDLLADLLADLQATPGLDPPVGGGRAGFGRRSDRAAGGDGVRHD
jgi:hypothetical protein